MSPAELRAHTAFCALAHGRPERCRCDDAAAPVLDGWNQDESHRTGWAPNGCMVPGVSFGALWPFGQREQCSGAVGLVAATPEPAYLDPSPALQKEQNAPTRRGMRIVGQLARRCWLLTAMQMYRSQHLSLMP